MRLKVLAGRVWRNLNRRLSRLYVGTRLDPADARLVRLGSAHGGWHLPADMPAGAVAYCGGVGLDASFDFALAERGLEVHSFDPTPSSIDYMARENDGRVAFHPWGMIGADRTVRFHAPIDPAHQSWFAENLHATADSFEAPCLRIATIMQRLGHARLDFLKIDIEGSWYPVIPDMLASGVRPAAIGLEFDSPAPVWRVARVMRALERAGYRAVHREGDNVTFLREAAR